jgi:hypothetical protein
MSHPIAYAHFIQDRLKGQTVHIVGSGPSLRSFDYEQLRGKNCIATNNSYKKVPWALWTVAVDRGFLVHEDVAAAKSTTLICRNNVPGVVFTDCITSFSVNPHDGVYHKKLSGLMAVTTAIHAGASRIFLWGHDCCNHDGLYHGTDGEFNHRGNAIDDHKKDHSLRMRAKLYKVFAEKYPGLIFNVSPISAIPYFDRITPEQALSI